MPATFETRAIRELLKTECYDEQERPAEETGFAVEYRGRLSGLTVRWAIRKRDPEHPGGGARVHLQITRDDGSVFAESEDATYDWFEDILP